MSAHILWLNVSPALQRFSRPLLQSLSSHYPVYEWAYSQSLDEPLDLDIAVDLLAEHLATCADQPPHLIGHSTGGLLAFLLACRYPQYLRSLTLLAVGADPSLDWQAHYYAQAQCTCCSRHRLLGQMVYNLFGQQSRSQTLALMGLLQQDLLTSLSPHTLIQSQRIPVQPIPVPTLICGGEADVIIDAGLFQAWQLWLPKTPAQQSIWLCPGAGHFFQFEQPQLTSQQICRFYADLESAQSHTQTMLLQTKLELANEI